MKLNMKELPVSASRGLLLSGFKTFNSVRIIPKNTDDKIMDAELWSKKGMKQPHGEEQTYVMPYLNDSGLIMTALSVFFV